MPVRVAPDVEQALITLLAASVDLQAQGVQVNWQLGAVRPGLVITRVGGITVVREHARQIRVDVDAYDRTRATALAAALTAQAVLESTGRTGYAAPGIVITAIATATEPIWSFEENLDQHRYTTSYLITCHRARL